MALTEEVLRRRFAAYRPRPPVLPEPLSAQLRPAAVLVPLLRAEEWRVLLTRRTETVANHKGQVALPGGAVEPGDRNAVDTALREAYEELGIPPQAVDIIGTLDPQPVISGYLVTPVVGIVPPDLRLFPAAAEIARVFTVPLSWLADLSHVRVEEREWAGMRYPVYFYAPYEGEIIWGLTARILRNLLHVLFPGKVPPPAPPSRVESAA